MTSLKFPDGSEVLYELTRKPVKNINLRVKEDGSLRISASPRVSVKRVEEFIISEQAFIRRAQQRISEREEHSEIRADIFRWLGGEYFLTGNPPCGSSPAAGKPLSWSRRKCAFSHAFPSARKSF